MTKILNINATKSVGKNASLELENEDLISSVNTILSFTPIPQLFHGYPEPELSNTTLSADWLYCLDSTNDTRLPTNLRILLIADPYIGHCKSCNQSTQNHTPHSVLM